MRISLVLATLSILLFPGVANADLEIYGTVNGYDIKAASDKSGALQVPYSKEIYVQGSITNTSTEMVHMQKITVQPDIMFFPEIEYAADEQMQPGFSHAKEHVVTLSTFIERYVPAQFISWIQNTTMKITVRAYQHGSTSPLAQRTVWVFMSDTVEAVPRSAIQAIWHNSIAQAGVGIAGISAAAGAAHTMHTRKRGKGKGIGGKLLAATSMGIGVAITLLAIGAISPFEFFEIDAVKGGLGTAFIALLLAIAL